MTERDRPLVAAATEVVHRADLEAVADLDRSGRVGRTAVQVGVPGALVVIGSWAARLAGLDLDPGAGTDLPADVAGAFVAVLGVLLAVHMNREPDPPKEP